MVSPAELSQHFNLSPEEAQAFQDRKEITWNVLHDEIGTNDKSHKHYPYDHILWGPELSGSSFRVHGYQVSDQNDRPLKFHLDP